MVTGIYLIANIVDNKVYVGKSLNIDHRLSKHERELRANTHKNTHLQQAWNKHGANNFVFFRLEVCDKALLNERECYWINHYKSVDSEFGYNKTSGGDGGRLNDESLAKMAASQRGKKHSKATKLKIKQANIGKPRPQEVKDKISKSKIGEVKSPEHKKRISNALKGQKLTKKTKIKMSKARKGKKQKIITCPQCGKLGGTAMHRWHFNNCRDKR